MDHIVPMLNKSTALRANFPYSPIRSKILIIQELIRALVTQADSVNSITRKASERMVQAYHPSRPRKFFESTLQLQSDLSKHRLKLLDTHPGEERLQWLSASPVEAVVLGEKMRS